MTRSRTENNSKIDVITYDARVDYPRERTRLQGALQQIFYEIRLAHQIADHPDIAMLQLVKVHDVVYHVSSSDAKHVKIANDDQTYVFEANFTGESPTLREYMVEGDSLLEIVPGEDEAGCSSLARAAQILIAANMAPLITTDRAG